MGAAPDVWCQQDLTVQHGGDALRNALGHGPDLRDWQMFRASTPQPGTGDRWCVYPHDSEDPFYKCGLWFTNMRTAMKVLDWKKERVALRPWWITRLVVRAWRALPWR